MRFSFFVAILSLPHILTHFSFPEVAIDPFHYSFVSLGYVEILKVGHHGSDSSTSGDFLNRVKTEVAVISVGYDNRYGRPYADTLARLQAAGATIYRTDSNGNIVLNNAG